MKREGEGSNKRTKKQKSAIPEEDVMKQGMEFFETKWARIQKYITELTNALQGDITELNNVLDVLKDKEACVTDTIYELCKKAPPPDFAEELYSKYEEVLTEYARDRVLPSIKEKNGEDMLRVLVKSRSRYKILVEWLSSRFSFLGRNYIPVRKCSTLNQVAQTCFYDLVYKEVKINAREPVFVLITKERDGEKIDRLLLKNVIDIYVEMKSYAIDFEEIMLRNTGAYYSRNAKDWIREDSWPEYMLRVEACLQEERERVSAYLHLTKEQKLVMVVEDKLLKNYAKQLLEKLGEENSGCWELFRDDKLEDLSRMYRLYSKIPKGLESVSAIFKQHITDEGTALVQQAADPASNQEQVLIQEIIELNNKFMVHVVDCFQGHNLFYKAIKEAFEKFCNKTVGGSCIAELLATFCHNILRKKDEKKGESENVSDEAIEETFKKVMKWLGYIKDKCLFAEFCRKNLADRLLFNRSAKIEHERSILRELKQKYGGRFTSKMEGMITDFTVSKHNHTEFENYLGNNPNALPGIDLSVNVLSGCWPSYKTSAINLPPEMVKCAEVFKGFYDENYQRRRKLTWIYSMGSCHLNGMFEQKNIELIVSTYQAALLLLFDTSDKLSYSEIQTQLNLTHDDTDGLLHSLSCDKYKILTKEPNTKTVSRTDYFEFNHKFTHKRERIKIPLPPVDETKTIVEDVDKTGDMMILTN